MASLVPGRRVRLAGQRRSRAAGAAPSTPDPALPQGVRLGRRASDRVVYAPPHGAAPGHGQEPVPARGRGATPSPAVQRRTAWVLAALALCAALYTWFAPLTAPGQSGLPFGCGSVAHPDVSPLAAGVCATTWDSHALAAGLLVLCALVAVLVGQVLGRAVGAALRAWSVGALLAAPLLAAAAFWLFVPLDARSVDGATVAPCGRAVAPTADAFARGLCADLQANRLAAGLASALAGLVVLTGVPYAGGVLGRRR